MMSEEEKKYGSAEAEPAEKPAPEAAPEAPPESAGGDAGGDAQAPAGEAGESGDEQSPDWKDMYARLLADFDNYRKRVSRDREELVKFAASDAIGDMLGTADNLALARGQAKDQEDPFVKGVKLAYEGFLKALKDHGAEPFESVGEVLDPSRHEAIATLPSDSVEEGRISNEAKKGWMLNGRLLRAAQVVVSSGPAK